jgi:hypothetical protein
MKVTSRPRPAIRAVARRDDGYRPDTRVSRDAADLGVLDSPVAAAGIGSAAQFMNLR